MRLCWMWIAILTMAFLASSAANARAEAPEGAKAESAHGQTTDENKEPSLFERALDLSIWTIAVFLILLFVLGRYAWKPMLQGLEQREHSIQSAMEEAKKAKEEAQALRNQPGRAGFCRRGWQPLWGAGSDSGRPGRRGCSKRHL